MTMEGLRYRAFQGAACHGEHGVAFEVETGSADRFAESREMLFVAFMKIDTEGAELAVFEEAEETR